MSAVRGHALVTGASSGIGVDLARELARRGYSLVLVARREARLRALAGELEKAHGVSVIILAHDLSVTDAAPRLHQAVRALGLDIEVLVNNAGFGIQGPFLAMDPAAVEQMMRLNITTLTHLTQLFAREMVERRCGYVLNVASAAAFLPTPFLSAYAATKSYVMSFGEALSHELRGTGVSLTTLYPGITQTEFNEVAHAKTPGVMNLSILTADAVAGAGVRAMFKRRREVVPGLINKLNAILCTILPRGLVVWITGVMIGRANGV